MYLQPKVIYRDVNDSRKNSIIRYIGNRVLRNNKNFMCAVTGPTGVGKSWGTGSMQEIYSQMLGVEYNPEDHIMFSLKEVMELIHNKDLHKKIKFGSTIMIDELQVEANSRTWQSESNLLLNRLTSTFRNQRLTVFFCTPYIEMIDKQSRILFHAEFRMLGFNKNTGKTKIKPRFLEWSSAKDDFYRHRLEVSHPIDGKKRNASYLLDIWEIDKPSDQWIETYEAKKKAFSDKLNAELYKMLNKDPNNVEKKEKVDVNTNFDKVQELYKKYGEDYLKIREEMPYLSTFTIEKYIIHMKKSEKARKMVSDIPSIG